MVSPCTQPEPLTKIGRKSRGNPHHLGFLYFSPSNMEAPAIHEERIETAEISQKNPRRNATRIRPRGQDGMKQNTNKRKRTPTEKQQQSTGLAFGYYWKNRHQNHQKKNKGREGRIITRKKRKELDHYTRAEQTTRKDDPGRTSRKGSSNCQEIPSE